MADNITSNSLVDLNTLNIAYSVNKKRIDFFSKVINPCYKEGEGDNAKEGVEISKPITVRDKDATSTFEGGLAVKGNASIDGTLKVADNFEVGANSASFNKEVEFKGTLKATESATFDKEVTLKSDLKLSSWSITQDADGSLVIKYNA